MPFMLTLMATYVLLMVLTLTSMLMWKGRRELTDIGWADHYSTRKIVNCAGGCQLLIEGTAFFFLPKCSVSVDVTPASRDTEGRVMFTFMRQLTTQEAAVPCLYPQSDSSWRLPVAPGSLLHATENVKQDHDLNLYQCCQWSTPTSKAERRTTTSLPGLT